MAAIYCFSSTGNSLYTANKIAGRIGGKVLSMRGGPAVCEDDVIGFVFPVYYWALPRMVKHFIEKLQIINKNPYIFAVTTSGGKAFGVLGLLKKLLQYNGARLRYGENIISVSNYLPEYDANDSDALRQNVEAQILRITDAIMRREEKKVVTLPLLNKLVFKFCPGEDCDRHFNITSICNGCATCQKVCPADNIDIEAGRITFQHTCEHCLACLHNCPVQAIDWKQKTQGKTRYRNAGIRLSELIALNNQPELDS